MEQLSSDQYGDFKRQLQGNKFNFQTIETTYTKRIKTESKNFMFSDDKRDFNELKLINLVKKDCNKFCDTNNLPELVESDIDFYKFYSNGLFDSEYKYVWKIDLSSAYWTYAINCGMIQESTVDFFEQNKDNFFNGPKKARLKALGSCATKKLQTNYLEGVQFGDPVLLVNDVLRNLYLNVCNEVDRVMKAIAHHYKGDCIYYYWDCLFINQKIDPLEVIEFIKQFGFNAKFEKSAVTVKTKYVPMLCDIQKNIDYPVRKSDLEY